MKRYAVVALILSLGMIYQGCDSNSIVSEEEMDLTKYTYNPTAYELSLPPDFQEMPIPADNPLTVEGVELGRHLFYEKLLSGDTTQSCASCHFQESNFTDNLPVSVGIDGIAGRRSAMSLLNIGFNTNGLFWDGRVMTLEEQALIPIEDPIELHTTWREVIDRLQAHPTYPKMFREAFGIESVDQIDKFLAAKAIAQFERTIVSSGNSKYDRVIADEDIFTDEELAGFNIFFDIDPDRSRHLECGHCHNAPLFTTNEFTNNGVNDVDGDGLFDLGRAEVTDLAFDRGVFRIPTLRNIANSGPFMHDGRFSTLDEVIDHYSTGGIPARNLDPLLRPLNISEEDRNALKAFLKTLEDPDFANDPRYSSPF